MIVYYMLLFPNILLKLIKKNIEVKLFVLLQKENKEQ